jgi:hypothetical protein
MYWKVLDSYRYKLPGGYLCSVTPTGSATLGGTPTETSTLLKACEQEQSPHANLSNEAALADDLRELDISTIVVTDVAPIQSVAPNVHPVLGGPAHKQSEAWGWDNVQTDQMGSP